MPLCAIRANPSTAAGVPVPEADAAGRPGGDGRGEGLAGRIRGRRYAIGWGPDDLATRAGISRTALYHIESGQTRHPRAQTLMSIAHALGVEISELLGGAAPAPRPPRRGAAPGPGARRASSGPDDPARGAEREVRRKFEDLLASPMGPAFVAFLEVAHGLISATGEAPGMTGPEAGAARHRPARAPIPDPPAAR